MKATIDEHGMLKIQANSALESYALTKWCESNFSRAGQNAVDTTNIVINIGFKE